MVLSGAFAGSWRQHRHHPPTIGTSSGAGPGFCSTSPHETSKVPWALHPTMETEIATDRLGAGCHMASCGPEAAATPLALGTQRGA